MNNIDRQYKELSYHILNFGVDKADRTGTGTKSIFGWQIRHNMKDGFPLLTTKKMAWKSIVTELLWFLRGDTNIKFLHDNNCHIWDGDYIKSGRTDGELGPIYGAQWRKWGGLQDLTDDDKPIYLDQIANLINELKINPDSRRLMVSAWNVGELDQMILPPCHYSFQCYVREGKYLSLMWNQRSVDTFLGLPFNIASYGLLLEIIAKEVNMIPDELIGNLGDVHLYNNHIKQAEEQLSRTPYELPKLNINSEWWDKPFFEAVKSDNFCKCLLEEDIQLYDYKSHPAIKAPLSN
jgi:thymidylate synthase